MSVTIRGCASVSEPGWLALRRALWPDGDEDEHRVEMAGFLDDPARYGQWLAIDVDGVAIGLVEASIRHDYVNGTESSPVAFVEGLYVDPAFRRRGVASMLIDVVTRWGRDAGCRELASDAALDAVASHAMHRALGFEETERVVYFRRMLG